MSNNEIRRFLSTIFKRRSNISRNREIEPLPNRDIDPDKNIITPSVLGIFCPFCDSQNYVKRGVRQKKRGKVQLYLCKNCLKTFTPSWEKRKQHPWKIILNAISYYNLGFSLADTCKIMKEKQNENIQPSTLALWLERHGDLCVYLRRMRSYAVKEFSPYEVIETATLAHRQLYRFRYHRAKIKFSLEEDFKNQKLRPLKDFLDLVTSETPHQFFQEGLRASESPIKFSKSDMIVRSKENFATKLAGLVFQGVKENKQRHEELQKFMIANDSVTVATEVPIYLRKEDLSHMQTQLGFEMYERVKKVHKGKEECRGVVLPPEKENVGANNHSPVPKKGRRGNVGADLAPAQAQTEIGTPKELVYKSLAPCVLGLPHLIAEAHSIRFGSKEESIVMLERVMLNCNKLVVYLEQVRDICETDTEWENFDELIKKIFDIRRKVLHLQMSWKKYMLLDK